MTSIMRPFLAQHGVLHRRPSPPLLPRITPPSSSPLLGRLEHMTFAWYTSCMSLGGVSNLLLNRIIDSDGLYYLGLGLFCLNIAYFVLLCSLQLVRFTCTAASLAYTLRHPIECLFIPTVLLASATIINGVSTLVGRHPAKWVEICLRIGFWAYCSASILISLVCYVFLFIHHEQNLHHMTPGWVLPIFPTMLCGSVASSVIQTQETFGGLPIAICGLTCQGLGLIVSLMMYAVLLLRLMTTGFPPAKGRPGLFMCCGPPAFTIICFLSLAREMGRILPSDGYVGISREAISDTLMITAVASSILLWMLSAWFYLLAAASIVEALVHNRSQVSFILAWWAIVFPITGFATATNLLGVALDSLVIRSLASVMVILLLVCLFTVGGFHTHAIYTHRILAGGKDEDRVIDTMEARIYGRGEKEAAYRENQTGHGVVDSTASTMSRHDQEASSHFEQMHRGNYPNRHPVSNPPTYPSTPMSSSTRLDKMSHTRSNSVSNLYNHEQQLIGCNSYHASSQDIYHNAPGDHSVGNSRPVSPHACGHDVPLSPTDSGADVECGQPFAGRSASSVSSSVPPSLIRYIPDKLQMTTFASPR